MSGLLMAFSALLSFPFGPLTAAESTPAAMTYETAWASQYDQGPTDATLQFQQDRDWLPDDLSPYTVFVATTLFCDVGTTGLIRPVIDGQRGEWERFISFDCAGHAETVEGFFRPNNIQIELDFYTAERWDTIGRGIEVDLIWLD